jgi:hypothetical protein
MRSRFGEDPDASDPGCGRVAGEELMEPRKSKRSVPSDEGHELDAAAVRAVFRTVRRFVRRAPGSGPRPEDLQRLGADLGALNLSIDAQVITLPGVWWVAVHSEGALVAEYSSAGDYRISRPRRCSAPASWQDMSESDIRRLRGELRTVRQRARFTRLVRRPRNRARCCRQRTRRAGRSARATRAGPGDDGGDPEPGDGGPRRVGQQADGGRS